MVLDQIWQESRDYYLNYHSRLIGELVISPAGSIKRKKAWGGWFLYLHRRKGKKFEDIYLGSEINPKVIKIASRVKHRQRLIRELRSAKKALKLLRAGKMLQTITDFTEPLRKLLSEMDRIGLFEAGVELVGSYCFKIYQNRFDVERFPLQTIDVDFVIPKPYKGPKTDLEALLKMLGFRQEFSNDGTIFYEGNGLIVEFLQPRKGGGSEKALPVDELYTTPIPLPYLDMLLENKVTVSLRDIGRIALPSLPAFMLHKLLIANLPQRKDKSEKDYRQAEAVAKKIITDANLIHGVGLIKQSIPSAWRRKIEQSAQKWADQSGNKIILEVLRKAY